MMRSIALIILGGFLTLVAFQFIGWVRVADIPTVPESIRPQNGDVVEYWPNGRTRSERVYRDDKVHEAVYYSSNGEVVYEMSENN
jgi:hypothetical protein